MHRCRLQSLAIYGGLLNSRGASVKTLLIALMVVGVLVGGSVWAVLAYAARESQAIISFMATDGGKESRRFSLRVAASEPMRNKGLMFVKELAPDQGMLFAFYEDGPRAFWMKNTYVSLDMLFVDSDWRVVGIKDKTPVLSEALQTVDKPSKYVIELVAGTAASEAITVGSKVIIHHLPKAVLNPER